MRTLMTLTEAAKAADLTRQAAAKRVAALDIGILLPGRKRPLFDECDVMSLKANMDVIKTFRDRIIYLGYNPKKKVGVQNVTVLETP